MIEIKNLSKSFPARNGHDGVDALKDVSLTIDNGDIFGIIGMSGAGKSTLVRCINLLERPDDGNVIVDGINLNELSESELRKKRQEITMIFQNFNLLSQCTVLKNVLLPLELQKINSDEAKKKALDLLDIVGLKDKANAYPSQLSGGQKQRVAIARALTTNPQILLCDEATSALDPTTTKQILDLLRDINSKYGITIIVITHQMSVVESICKHVAIIDQGEVVEKGEVVDIFSHPKSNAAKKLVFPEADKVSLGDNQEEKYVRVVFDGSKTTNQPLITRLAKEKGIEANIVYASIRNLNEKTYGSLILGVKNNDELKEVKNYLSSVDGILCEEFTINA